ncbi:MAG: saccharopine dehydrogenase family protein [Promethearchaeota archaeon]
MIYGVYGYTGNLLAKEAILRGNKPILAGRNEKKLSNLAKKLDLEYIAFDLNDEKVILSALDRCEVLLNAAGPFTSTSKPLVEACLATSTNYLDITGEISVFEQNFKYDREAKEKSIAIISGVGFDVVPTDCMASYIGKKLPDATNLDIGIAGMNDVSRGTFKTMLQTLPLGDLFRRNSLLVSYAPDTLRKKVRFYDVERYVVPVRWGDLSTAYKTTNIPNITTYAPYSKRIASLLKASGAFEPSADKSKLNKIFERVEKQVYGPDEKARQEGKSHIWVRATNEVGKYEEAWLQTIEPYRFTAKSGILCVEKVIELRPIGALTPSLAFGHDFVLNFPDTYRYDNLE